MSSVIEQTVKALVAFESELDQAKTKASESSKKMLKDATSWAESAKASGILKAQQMASETLASARAEAEKEADAIRKTGESSLKSFEASMSRKKGQAVEKVVGLLLGESQ